MRFLVSTEESKGMVAAGGFEATVLGGDPHCLDESDARRVAELCVGDDAALLVDAYGVSEPYSDAFFEAGIRTAYIDDGFFYSTGYHAWMRPSVDVVIDCRFGADERALSELYRGSGAVVLAGPRFAPVDERFRGVARGVAADVSRVLVTCGSTNPGGTLERMTRACRVVLPDARIDVAVGKFARFELGELDGARGRWHRWGLWTIGGLRRLHRDDRFTCREASGQGVSRVGRPYACSRTVELRVLRFERP